MPIEDSALSRLAVGRDRNGGPFLQPHHLLAANRLERLIQRAQLTPRMTMSYDPARAPQSHQTGNGAAEMSESASAARQRLNQLAQSLPSDCWDVMFDVCGMGKGLQAIESERRWPRRSAKLVLRIGLSQLAAHFGLTAEAVGAAQRPTQSWRSERLPIIPAAHS